MTFQISLDMLDEVINTFEQQTKQEVETIRMAFSMRREVIASFPEHIKASHYEKSVKILYKGILLVADRTLASNVIEIH